MSKPKSNTEFRVGFGHWCADVLEEFIKFNPVPESWGANTSQRRNAGLRLVQLATSPELLSTPESYINGSAHLHNVIGDHVSFANYFSLDPGYFIKLISHAHERANDQKQFACVTKILREMSDTGQPLGDKEIAYRAAQALGILAVDTSAVGKARKQLVKRDTEIRATEARVIEEAAMTAMENLNRLKTSSKDSGTTQN